MTFEDLQKDIRLLLMKFRTQAELAAAGGEDISNASAQLCLELFREAFELPDLRDMNAERKHFPAIDLADDTRRQAFQVTADSDLAKVLKCLATFVEHDLHRTYTRLRIFVTTKRQSAYRSQKIASIVGGKLQFDPKSDILDCNDLANLFATFDIERLTRIARILHAHLDGASPVLFDSLTFHSVEQGVEARYTRALRRSTFIETDGKDEFRDLARQIIDSRLPLTSSLKRRVLLRAARRAAVGGRADEAREFFSEATKLDGPPSDLPARARLAEMDGNSDEAIRIVRDASDPDCRTVLFSVLLKSRGAQAAVEWFRQSGLVASDFSTDGVIVLVQALTSLGDHDQAARLIGQVDHLQLHDGLHITFIRGVARLASVFAKPDWGAVMGMSSSGLRLSVDIGPPVLSDAELSIRLNDAIDDLQRSIPELRALDLREAADAAEWFSEWAKLLHPQRRELAIRQLQVDMSDPRTAMRRLPFAFAFLQDFDSRPIETWIDKREMLGGLDNDDLRGYLSIFMHQRRSEGIVKAFSRHRERLTKLLGVANAVSIELHALTFAGDPTSARALLNAQKGSLDPEIVSKVEAEIATAEGADRATEFVRMYEANPSVMTLRALVGVLVSKTDHRALGLYAELLFTETRAPSDIELAASAYANAGEESDFVRLMDAHSFIQDQAPQLQRKYLWSLINAGRLNDAKQLADRVRTEFPARRDLDLEVAIALDTGHWESVSSALATYLERSDEFDAETLIRAASLSQASGIGPLRELIDAAVNKAEDDPHVLIGAYLLSMEAGLEDTDTRVHGWFSRAVELSNADGPVRSFELKELLAQQVEWNAQTNNISDLVTSGEAPLFVAAQALRTSLVELLLGNLVANEGCKDARRRTAIPLFSGVRKPSRIGDAQCVALDLSSVLTLGWLNLLSSVLDAFPKIIVPFGLMRELFEGRRRLRSYQRTRVARALEVQGLIAHGLKVLRSTYSRHAELAQEIGEELCSLLEAADKSQGIVVRPAPVPRLDLSARSNVDMSKHQDRLTDMHALLSSLSELGVIDAGAEKVASDYFKVQDVGWEKPAKPAKHVPLYLDSVAVSYLQATKLLKLVVDTFDSVFVSDAVEEESNALLQMDQRAVDVLKIIDSVRTAVHSADKAGRIVFAARAKLGDDAPQASTMQLVSNLRGADAVCIDDRALNKLGAITVGPQQQAKTATTLDLVEELCARKVISEDQRTTLRHRLRCGGAVLMPLDRAEVRFAAERSAQSDSAELKAIRESLSLVRVRGFPKFPEELAWFASSLLEINGAFVPIWKSAASLERAAEISDSVLAAKIDPVDWLEQWRGNAPPEWTYAVTRVDFASLLFPAELADDAVRDAYHEWLDERLIARLRVSNPKLYSAVIEQLKAYVSSLADRGLDLDG